jgi:hypothetical protein
LIRRGSHPDGRLCSQHVANIGHVTEEVATSRLGEHARYLRRRYQTDLTPGPKFRYRIAARKLNTKTRFRNSRNLCGRSSVIPLQATYLAVVKWVSPTAAGKNVPAKCLLSGAWRGSARSQECEASKERFNVHSPKDRGNDLGQPASRLKRTSKSHDFVVLLLSEGAAA